MKIANKKTVTTLDIKELTAEELRILFDSLTRYVTKSSLYIDGTDEYKAKVNTMYSLIAKELTIPGEEVDKYINYENKEVYDEIEDMTGFPPGDTSLVSFFVGTSGQLGINKWEANLKREEDRVSGDYTSIFKTTYLNKYCAILIAEFIGHNGKFADGCTSVFRDGTYTLMKIPPSGKSLVLKFHAMSKSLTITKDFGDTVFLDADDTIYLRRYLEAKY